MVREICRDVLFLGQKSESAKKENINVAQDLLDTLAFNAERCVGMAANMIGIKKRIIVVNVGLKNMIMFNPVITKKHGEYEAEEGCLSLIGVRKTTRYKDIDVEYQDMSFKQHKDHFSGWTAQIIQHECDHMDGIII